MSKTFEVWVAITLGQLCFRLNGSAESDNLPLMILGVCWLGFAVWRAIDGLRGSL